MRSRSSSRMPARRSRSSKTLDAHLASDGLRPFDRNAPRASLAGRASPVPGGGLKQTGSPSSGTDNACVQALAVAKEEWAGSVASAKVARGTLAPVSPLAPVSLLSPDSPLLPVGNPLSLADLAGIVPTPVPRDRLISISLVSIFLDPAVLDPDALDPNALDPISADLIVSDPVVLESLQDPVPRCAGSCRDSAFAPPARSDVPDPTGDLPQATPNRPLPRLCRVTEPVRDPDASRRVHDLLVH